MAEWIVNGRFTFDGQALIEAETMDEAAKKFAEGDFEFDHATGSITDWEKRGKIESAE